MPVKCPSSAARGAIYTTKVTNYEVNYEIVFQKKYFAKSSRNVERRRLACTRFG